KIQIVGLSHPGMRIKAAQQVPPGGEASVTVIWDTQAVRGDTTAKALLRLNETEAASLTLSAKIVPPIGILPYAAVFISGFRNEQVTRTLEITNNESTPVNITGLRGAEGASTFSANLKTLDPGRRYQLDVQLKPDGPGGRSQHALQILTDHPRFSVINVPVNVLLKDEVYVNPDSVEFGEITGEPGAAETFFLKKRAGSVRIVSV